MIEDWVGLKLNDGRTDGYSILHGGLSDIKCSKWTCGRMGDRVVWVECARVQ